MLSHLHENESTAVNLLLKLDLFCDVYKMSLNNVTTGRVGHFSRKLPPIRHRRPVLCALRSGNDSDNERVGPAKLAFAYQNHGRHFKRCKAVTRTTNRKQLSEIELRAGLGLGTQTS